jgi:hypothetical protein
MSDLSSFSQVFEQEIETAWSETVSNLTPEQKKMLMNSTPQDWAAFVTGIAQGFSNAK